MSISGDMTTTAPDFRELFERAPVRALIVDRNGRILALNAEMRGESEQSGGLGAAEGRFLDEVFEGQWADIRSDLFAAASNGQLVLRPRHPGPGTARQRFRVRAIRRNGATTQFALYEVSGPPAEKTFLELNRLLRDANERAATARLRSRELEQSIDRLEHFSAMAAHDLKAPLRNISTLLDFLTEDYGRYIPSDALRMLRKATSCLSRLQGLITALLDHARSDCDQITPEDLDVGEIVECVRAELSEEIESSGGTIMIEGRLGRVFADPHLFLQIVENVVGNAFKYRSPDRPPIVTIRRETVDDGTDRLIIRDNGRGFDPAQKHRLFEPFRRLHADTAIEGSGIGLATCRRICERHGWTIDADGMPEGGASFFISGLRSEAFPVRRSA